MRFALVETPWSRFDPARAKTISASSQVDRPGVNSLVKKYGSNVTLPEYSMHHHLLVVGLVRKQHNITEPKQHQLINFIFNDGNN
mmetsp:Transcript_40344/g.46224  ORF Transcript_40344/g.46224 Transcript_40344/m.46224 type:complete len:85 (+) Transcript_40344:121-375(+)